MKKNIKKKKGRRAFTLIELLAVILILGIIALIAFPNVNNAIKTSRKKAFALDVTIIKRESEKQFITNMLHGNAILSYCNMNEVSPNCSALEINKKDEKYLVDLDDHGHVKNVYVSNGQYCYAANGTSTDYEVTINDIEEGALDCSSEGCTCFNSEGKGKATIIVNNGRSEGNTVTVDAGENPSFTIIPDDGYTFEDAEVIGNCTLEGDKVIFKNISGAHTCRVIFHEPKYAITLNCPNCKSKTQIEKVEFDSDVVFTVVPENGYKLENAVLEGNGCTLSNNKVIFEKINGTKSCTLSLTKQAYTITTTCTGCSSNPSNVSVDYGESKSIELSPASGYTLEGATVSGNGCSVVGSTLIVSNVTKNVSCSVTLPKAKYNVNISCTGCTSTPTSAQVEHGLSKTFTIAASTNYSLTGATVSGDGCSLDGSTLTVSNVTSARTCTVSAKATWHCTQGTLTADSTKGSSSGGYVCVTSANRTYKEGDCNMYSCSGGYRATDTYCAGGDISGEGENGYYYIDCSCTGCGGYPRGCSCTHYICNNATCISSDPGEYVYTCPSGWKTYSGSGSSLKCYKAATQ